MKRKCKTCGYTIEDENLVKCPRCATLLDLKFTCENCRGCSIFNHCKKARKEQTDGKS